MAEATEVVVKRTFWSWVEKTPSSLIINAGGGERMKDASGRILAMPMREIRFNQGRFQTDDPELIAVLEKLIKQGENITEDREVYLSKILPPEQNAERLRTRLADVQEENKRTNALMEKLKAEREPQTISGAVETTSSKRMAGRTR